MLDGCVPWPEELSERYRREGYWRGVTLGDLLREWAGRYGPRTAIVEGGRRWSYAELDRRVDRMAAGLRALGIGRGDRVVVHLPNVGELVELCFALFRLGALPVLALPAHRSNEISHLCRVSDAVAYCIPDVHQGFDYRTLAAQILAGAPGLRHVLVAGEPGGFTALGDVDADPEPLDGPDPAEVAFFLLSGGTTGLPKLIPRTHDDYAYNVAISAGNAELDAQDAYLAALPVAHNFTFGCPGVLGTFRAGGKVVLASSGSPDEAFPLIAAEGVTVSALVPPLALLWMEASDGLRPDLSTLRLLQVGGATFNPEPARRLPSRLGCRLQQSFGMAEGLLSQTRPDDTADVVTCTQGLPLSPADEVSIVDDAGRKVEPGAVGELLVRGPYTIRGYYRADAYNRTAFTPDGFFRTGDLVRRTAGGHLVVEGRIKDVVNRGGDKVPASEVEDHLLAHPAVREVAVVAMPDPVMGERSCAFVVPAGAVAADRPPRLGELSAFLRSRGMAAYKLPDRLEVVEALPRTGVGKVSKAVLRERIAETLRTEARRPLTRRGGR